MVDNAKRYTADRNRKVACSTAIAAHTAENTAVDIVFRGMRARMKTWSDANLPLAHRSASRLHPGALEDLPNDLFRFEEFAGDGARGAAVLLVIGVDLAHRFGDFA